MNSLARSRLIHSVIVVMILYLLLTSDNYGWLSNNLSIELVSSLNDCSLRPNDFLDFKARDFLDFNPLRVIAIAILNILVLFVSISMLGCNCVLSKQIEVAVMSKYLVVLTIYIAGFARLNIKSFLHVFRVFLLREILSSLRPYISSILKHSTFLHLLLSSICEVLGRLTCLDLIE